MATLGELRLARAQLETELERLRGQLGSVEEQLMELRNAQRHGRMPAEVLERHEDLVVELRREIQRRKIALSSVAEQIARAEVFEQQSMLVQLQQANDATKGELDLLRRELRNALLGMCELLRRHQRLAAEKQRITADLARLTGQDYAYENYIACALLHQRDYSGDVQFVLEMLKKSRPVA